MKDKALKNLASSFLCIVDSEHENAYKTTQNRSQESVCVVQDCILSVCEGLSSVVPD